MVDNEYWNKIITNLTDKAKANWAAHAIASNIEILEEILSRVDKQKFIKNCLICYSVDFSAQPYLDEILNHFSVKELIYSYKDLDNKPIQTAGALMWLLEDKDPEFK